MDVGTIVEHLICRMCLCKCENPRNMLVETDFANKVMEVFPKVVISEVNGLSNVVCDYCHNLIQQFHGYFETVNANQEELLKMLVPKEEVFAIPFEEPPMLKMKTEVKEKKSKVQKKKPKKTRAQAAPVRVSKKKLSLMGFFELQKLPTNFTWSYCCSLCPDAPSTRFKKRPLLKAHIRSTHFPDHKRAQSHIDNVDPQCDKCHKIIKVRQDHKFIHYNIKPYKCDLCSFSTHTKEILRVHLLKHETQIRHLGCFYCPSDFPSSFLRNQHISESHPNNIITCDLCGEVLYGKKLAKDHFRQHQNNAMKFECERCPGGVRFPSEEVLELHRQQHKREDQSRKKLSCHLCERKFNNANAMQVHLRYHANGRVIPCDICGKSVASDMNRKIIQHIKTHTDKQTVHKCDVCGAEFPSRQFLFHHHRKTHDPKEQSCYRCGKMLPEYFMKLHLFYCKGGVGIPCMHCPERFSKESERSLHTQKFHLGFNCRRCNMQFADKSQLKWHQKHDVTHVTTIKKRYKPLDSV